MDPLVDQLVVDPGWWCLAPTLTALSHNRCIWVSMTFTWQVPYVVPKCSESLENVWVWTCQTHCQIWAVDWTSLMKIWQTQIQANPEAWDSQHGSVNNLLGGQSLDHGSWAARTLPLSLSVTSLHATTIRILYAYSVMITKYYSSIICICAHTCNIPEN